MTGIRQNAPGVLACLAIAVPAWFLGKLFPVVGGAVIAILAGMAVTMVWKHKGALEQGIGFPSKKVLQWAVVLLGFGLDLTVILQTGRQSLPIIVCTIGTSLALSCALYRAIWGIGDHHRGGGRWGPAAWFYPSKELSKFLIVLAMAAIGLNSNLIKLIKTGGKPLVLGACC